MYNQLTSEQRYYIEVSLQNNVNKKGHIENTNGLVRQYITKKMAIKDIHDETIKQIKYKLNRRPRKKIGYHTPKETFFKNINLFRTCY